MRSSDMTPEQWLNLMPLPAVRAKIEQLEAEAQRVAADLQVWRELFALRSVDSEGAPKPALIDLKGTKPTVREAILTVLQAEGHAMAPATLRKKLVARGWVKPDRSGASQVYAMLSRMNKAGQVIRRNNGSYVLVGGEG